MQLSVPAQTLDGPFEVNLALIPISGCTVRKWEEGAAVVRVDDGSVYSLAYHVSPDDVNAEDAVDAGTLSKPCLSGYYLFQQLLKNHPDPTKPVMIYFHAGDYIDTGFIDWSTVRTGYYPEIDGTLEHSVKIENYPGDTLNSFLVGFLIEDRNHVHIKGFDLGSNRITAQVWVGKPEFLRFEDITIAGIRAATGSGNLGGIRLDDVGYTVIRNCNISDFKLDDLSLNHNLSPILTYKAHNILVEECILDDAAAGIYLKKPPAETHTYGEQAWTVRYNTFGSLLSKKIEANNNVVQDGRFDDFLIYSNTFLGAVGFSIVWDAANSSDGIEESGKLFVYNNTMVDCSGVQAGGHTLYHFNNAYRNSGSYLTSNSSSFGDLEGSYIAYSDYNISDVIAGYLRDGTDTLLDYPDKTTWNAAPASNRLLTANPDSNSFLESATFTNAGAGDYTITNANAANGFGGMRIGVL